MPADSMDDSAWQESILPSVRKLPESATAYSAGSLSLLHYHRVSWTLLTRFGDLALSRAAYLHGVDPRELTSLRPLPGVTEEIASILDERNRLRSLGGSTLDRRNFSDAEGDEVAHQLVTNVLPLIRDGRSVVLMVLEQTNHLDGDGSLSQWSLDFRFRPRSVPDSDQHFVTDHFGSMAARIHFLRFVVAAMADFFGLWAERNAALDVALFHENRRRFEEIVDRVLEDVEGDKSISGERVAFVRNRLGSAPANDVHWEWYSVASMHRHLGDDLTKEWGPSFDQLGCVTVICDDEQACYATLARLHAGGDFGDAAIRDYIGSPRPSGYRALQTALSRKGARPSVADLIPVHIMPKAGWERHIALSGAEQLDRIQGRIRSDEHRALTVFAPDGRAVMLPLGSAVLNFVVKLHTHLIPRVRGATVNRRSVGLLHPLREGDVVWIDMGDTPQLLPPDWESHVPLQTVASIRREIPRAYRKMLVTNGERWLREQLAEEGLEDASTKQLARATQSAAEQVLADSEADASWIYRQIGAHDAIERGVPILTPAIDRTQMLAIAAKTVANVRESPSMTAEYEIPAEFLGKFDDRSTCPICEPQSEEARSATLQKRVLVIHRANADCAREALVLRRPLRRVVRRHYFTAEVSNRANNLVEILSIFRDMQTDLAHVSARRLSAGWRVVRLGCDYVMPDRQQRILSALRALPGMMRVTGPEDPPIPAIEDALPPRSLDTPSMRRAEPYQVGPAIDDDRLFYGMEAELAKLEAIFARVTRRDAGSGEFVFINGSLRIGKTSLAKQFLRRLNRDLERKHFALYHMPSMEKWSLVAEAIRQTLLLRMPQLPPAVREQPTLEEAIREIQRGTGLPLVLVIDEIVGLLHLNSRWREEIEGFQRFCNFIRATPGVLVVWIGPTAAVRRLDDEIARVLTLSETVTPAKFNDDEVGAVLRAQKMDSLYTIHVKSALARAVRRLTDGNPYFVGNLGKKMFEIQATRHGQQEITYSHTVLELAKERLFLQPIAFAHQVPDMRNAVAQKKFAILRVLAGNKGENAYATSSTLNVALRGVMEPAEFREFVEDLYLGGVIQIENQRIKVATPLLAEYVRFITEEDHPL